MTAGPVWRVWFGEFVIGIWWAETDDCPYLRAGRTMTTSGGRLWIIGVGRYDFLVGSFT